MSCPAGRHPDSRLPAKPRDDRDDNPRSPGKLDARRLHNPEVVRFSPTPAIQKPLVIQGFLCLSAFAPGLQLRRGSQLATPRSIRPQEPYRGRDAARENRRGACVQGCEALWLTPRSRKPDGAVRRQAPLRSAGTARSCRLDLPAKAKMAEYEIALACVRQIATSVDKTLSRREATNSSGTAFVLLGFGVGVAVARNLERSWTYGSDRQLVGRHRPEVDALLRRLSSHGTQYFIPKCPRSQKLKNCRRLRAAAGARHCLPRRWSGTRAWRISRRPRLRARYEQALDRRHHETISTSHPARGPRLRDKQSCSVCLGYDVYREQRQRLLQSDVRRRPVLSVRRE